jgi:integrase
MASVISDPNGRKRIQFVAGDGSRRTIRLGKATMRQAEAVKVKIEQLVLAATSVTGVVDDETVNWLTGIDESMYDKLAGVGLVGRRDSVKLRAFLDAYIEERSDVKPGTSITYKWVRLNLTDFFGDDKPLREITPGEADQWRLYLVKQGMADDTIRRRCGTAKQFFRVAVRRKLVSANPFEDLKSATQGNPQRYYFITQAEAQKVLDACPDAQWRLLFALSRYGGLRCPSEHLALKWGDVDWDKGRMIVRSPKTAHHVGHDSRLVPLFPELLPYLREVFEQAEPGTEYVITRYRQANCNLRTQLERIIIKAGLKRWPKLFQNLRSTRETELAERWPEHVVCAWIGNSKAVARKHYLQVTEEHFERAAGISTSNGEAAQNAAQQNAEPCCTVSHTVGEPAKFNTEQDLATQCEGVVGDTGFEPVTSRV